MIKTREYKIHRSYKIIIQGRKRKKSNSNTTEFHQTTKTERREKKKESTKQLDNNIMIGAKPHI